MFGFLQGAPSASTLAESTHGSTLPASEIMRRFSLQRLTELHVEYGSIIARGTRRTMQEVAEIFNDIARREPNKFIITNWRDITRQELRTFPRVDADTKTEEARKAEEDLHQHIYRKHSQIVIEQEPLDSVMGDVKKYLDKRKLGDERFLQIRGDFQKRMLDCAIRQQMPKKSEDRLEQDKYCSRKAGLIDRAEEKLHRAIWPDEPYGYSRKFRLIMDIYHLFGHSLNH